MRIMTDPSCLARRISLALMVVVVFATANTMRAAEIFTVTMTATGDLSADYLAFGMDDTATDGYDENLDSPAPPSAPSGNNIRFLINDDISLLAKDYRGQADSAVWTLDVTLAPGASTTLAWTIPAGFSAEALEFQNGATTIDMQTTTSVQITQSGQYTIAYRAPTITNTAPVARNDAAAMWPADGTIDVTVLANDEDVDGDTLTITQVSDPPNGTATVSGSVIQYTPDVQFTGTDTFTYTISDGTATATATVTVTVYAGNVVAVRTHAAVAAPGSEFTVTINVSHDGTLDTLALDEILPLSDDQPPEIWQYVADSYSGPTRAATVSQTDRTLTIDFGASVPSSPFSLSYKVAVPANDTNQKTFSGLVRYRLAGDTEDRTQAMPDTTVQPGIPYHSADFTDEFGITNAPDWKIDANELQRLLFLFNGGGYYKVDPTTPDGFNVSTTKPTATSGYHSADFTDEFGITNAPDWKIDANELQRALYLFNHGGSYKTDATTPDGYNVAP